jgi:hypothetical protein
MSGVAATRGSPERGFALRWSNWSARTGISALDLWAFILPAMSFLQIAVVGRLIVSEIAAAVLLPWLLRTGDRLKAPRWLYVLLGAWFVSQVVTDLVVHSAFADWARGWAAIAFTLVNLVAILSLAATPRRARIFALGLAAGGAIGYFIAPNVYAATDPWKWAFAVPIGFSLAVWLSTAWAARRPWLPIVIFAAFGILNAFMQFRALSGVSMLTAGYLLLALLLDGRLSFRSPIMARIGVGFASYALAAVAVYVSLNAAAAADLFGDAAKARYDSQSGVVAPSAAPQGTATAGSSASATAAPANPLGVIAGGRAEILSSTQAIRDSPLLGHGSWAKDPKYVELQRKGLIDLGIPGGNAPTDPTLIPTHSYLLGSWVWAGLAGGLFWLAVAALALWTVASLFRVRTALRPLVVFVASWLLWNIAFSPYANTERLYASYGLAICLLGLQLARSAAKAGQMGYVAPGSLLATEPGDDSTRVLPA